MVEIVTSADGTPIALERFGAGPAVVLVGGMFCDRRSFRDLAEELAPRCQAVTYDRRGRGDSGSTPPYAVAREVEDLAAVLAALDGPVLVYGHSSGAGLALEAAAAGVVGAGLVLHEPPYGADDDASRTEAAALAQQVDEALAVGRPGDAVAAFLAASGMPPEAIAGASADPAMLAIAPTMPHDFAVMGDGDRGGVVPVDLVAAVTAPTVVLAGSASPPFFRDTATRLAELLPAGRLVVLEGEHHGAPPSAVAPAILAALDAPEPDGP